MKKIENEKLNPIQTESQVCEIISQLIKDLEFTADFVDTNPRDGAPDFLAKKLINSKREYRIAIELKGSSNIKDAIKYGTRTLKRIKSHKPFDKLLLILSNRNSDNLQEISKFKKEKKNNLTEIEIINLNDLESWAENLKGEFSKEVLNEVQILIRQISRKFISLISKNPDHLMSLEWRDLERTITELFNEIGFNATLTPGSKDGGKDVILECEINNEKKSFIVELKHWRSGQRVGKKAVKEFTQVIINEKRSKGLYLSTYGYSNNYYESLTEIERSKVKFGEKEKIVELCNIYEKIKNGIWLPVDNLEKALFENTK